MIQQNGVNGVKCGAVVVLVEDVWCIFDLAVFIEIPFLYPKRLVVDRSGLQFVLWRTSRTDMG